MKKLNTITLSETKGNKTIARADDLFTWIDSDFENWGTDKKEKKTESIELAVCEITSDATFAHLFTKPEEMSLTQSQIIEFCTNHKDKLRADGYATFFLFKVGTEYFVADVDIRSGGLLHAYVRRFSRARVWRAGFRHRIVIPQLALKTLDLDPQTLGTFVALEQRIAELEAWKAQVQEALREI